MKAVKILLAVLCLALSAIGDAAAGGGHGHGHSRVGVGIYYGPVWGPWGYPSPWYYPPPIVVMPEPAPVYIEQNEPPAGAFWHYCRSAGGYYPYVRECREGWLKVLPEMEK